MADREEYMADVNADGIGHVFYDLARWRLEEQIDRVESLDRKLVGTFTLNSALIALLAVAATFRGAGDREVVWGVLVAVVVVFMINMACAYAAYRLRQWQLLPNLVRLQDVSDDYPEDIVRLWAAREMTTAYRQNEETLQKKAIWVRRAIALTMTNLALAAVTAAVAVAP